jgi:hypothetical protein
MSMQSAIAVVFSEIQRLRGHKRRAEFIRPGPSTNPTVEVRSSLFVRDRSRRPLWGGRLFGRRRWRRFLCCGGRLFRGRGRLFGRWRWRRFLRRGELFLCGGGGDGSFTVGGGSSAVGGGSSVDGGGAEGSAAVGDDVGASVVVVGASLVPAEDGEGVEDAGCDVGAPSEAEEDSPPRVGAAELLLLAGPLDGLAATSMALPDGQGVAELAAAIPSRKLRRMGFSS